MLSKNIIISACGLLLGIGSFAQNVIHDSYAEARTVSNFNKIRISGAFSVYLSQGNQQGIAISSQDGKYNSRIKTDVVDSVLKIYVDNGMWNNWNWSNKNIKAYITVTELQLLDVGGASNVKITDPLSQNDLKIDLSGASNLSGVVKSNSLNIEVSGASSMNIDGSADDMKIDASGASSFKGFDFTSTNCNVETSGASDVNIAVTKQLKAEASGASSIKYSGEAVITQLDVSSGSSVKKKS